MNKEFLRRFYGFMAKRYRINSHKYVIIEEQGYEPKAGFLVSFFDAEGDYYYATFIEGHEYCFRYVVSEGSGGEPLIDCQNIRKFFDQMEILFPASL